MTTAEFILRLMTAAFAGMIIGFERQWHQKSAGLRTNALVVVTVNTLLLPLDE